MIVESRATRLQFSTQLRRRTGHFQKRFDMRVSTRSIDQPACIVSYALNCIENVARPSVRLRSRVE